MPKRMVIATLVPAVIIVGLVGFLALNGEPETPPVQTVAVTEANFPQEDRQQILDILLNQDVTIPAGNQLDVNFDTITGNKVSGSFNYSNGVKGTYTAEKKDSKWSVVDYKKL